MYAQILNGCAKTPEPLILGLTVKVTKINLLQYHRHTPVSVNPVKREIGRINSGFILVQIQDFLPRSSCPQRSMAALTGLQTDRVVVLHPVGQ